MRNKRSIQKTKNTRRSKPAATIKQNNAKPLETEKDEAPGKFMRMDGANLTATSDALDNKITSSQGNGSKMDNGTRSFMESRFGSDFSSVKIHTGSESVMMNRELNAKAFTVGNDIYFNEGQYNPNSDSGKHLLAHELTHTIQQGNGAAVQRRLHVKRPAATHAGVTNAVIVQGYLRQLCAPCNAAVNSSSGNVALAADFCNRMPGRLISPAMSSPTPFSCTCLCDIVTSPHDWFVRIDDRAWPNTVFRDDDAASGVVAGGSGGTVTLPSPSSRREYGAVTSAGGFDTIPPWLILGHELCGHAWLGNRGAHGPDQAQVRGRGGHQLTVGRENLLRDEHFMPRRGTFRQAHCGESFSFTTGTVPSVSNVTFSRYHAECQTWRNDYNALNGTAWSIADDIPVAPGEMLPP